MIKKLDLLDDANPCSLTSIEIIENKINEMIDEINIQRIMIENEAKMMPRQNLHDWAKMQYERGNVPPKPLPFRPDIQRG